MEGAADSAGDLDRHRPDGSLGLTLDTGHLLKSGVSELRNVISSFAHILDNVHLKDFGAGEWAILGDGSLDLNDVVATLRDVGYRGWLCVDEESSTDLSTSLDRSWRRLADALGAVSVPVPGQ